jgi:hypothetical protein
MVELSAAQAFNMPETDQCLGDLLSPLHVGKEIRSTGEHHGARSFAIEDAGGLVDRARGAKVE